MKFVDESLLKRASEHALRFLQSVPDRPVRPSATRDQLVASLRVPLTDEGEDATAVLDAMVRDVDPGLLITPSPRFFGFVIGGSIPLTTAADWLTTVWDQNAGMYIVSPAASVVEEIAGNWLLDLFDLPRNASFGFVTGCQMANFTALAAARHGVLRKAGWNVEEQGLQGAPEVTVITGGEAHITIHSSLRMLGFGTKRVKQLPFDEQGRMRADDLRRAVADVRGPLIVCAQAGNVNSGAIDPLPQIAEIVHARGGWLHVDAAFGLWGRASRDRRPLLGGIELADSWATDAHKWLNVPYDNGIVIVRDAAVHRGAMTVSAAYIERSGAERDEFDFVPEFSRRARGFTVYAALRHLGRRGVESLVDRLCARARQFAELLGRDKRVKILNEVVLNQVLVRFGDSDDVTRDTIARIQQDGTCWLGGTTWHGMAAMRISVSNWATSEEDIERSAKAILQLLSNRTS